MKMECMTHYWDKPMEGELFVEKPDDMLELERKVAILNEEDRQKLRLTNHRFDGYEQSKLKPLSLESWRYMASLPSYEPLDSIVCLLPEEQGAYRIALKASSQQWQYLTTLFNQYEQLRYLVPGFAYKELFGIEKTAFSKPVPVDFFKDLPGVIEISFTDVVFFEQRTVQTMLRCKTRDDLAYYYRNIKINSLDCDAEQLHEGKHFRFDNTVQGAITALFLFAKRRDLADGVVFHLDSQGPKEAYPKDLGGCIGIPTGIRIHIVERDYYKVQCLAYQFGYGVYDLTVEVKTKRKDEFKL